MHTNYDSRPIGGARVPSVAARAAAVATAIATAMFAGAGPAVAQYGRPRTGAAFDNVWVLLLVVLSPILLAVAVMTYTHWWRPRRAHDEAQDYRASMNALTARYWAARNDLATRPVDSQADLASWRRDVERWHRDTADRLRRDFGEAACGRFTQTKWPDMLADTAAETPVPADAATLRAGLRARLDGSLAALQLLILDLQNRRMV